MPSWSVWAPRNRLAGHRATRPGGGVGYVGVPHGVGLDGAALFFTHVRLHGGPAPVRRYLSELIDLVWDGRSTRKVFDLTVAAVRGGRGLPSHG